MMKKYGVLGSDVSKSLSPSMHTANFKSLDINAAYKSISVSDFKAILPYLRKLDGFNVTTPFKETIIEYLDEINNECIKIGAVNTVKKIDGKLVGFNTDGIGFLESACEVCDIENKKVLLIGAGGAAKAIYHALKEVNSDITICNRTAKNILFAEDYILYKDLKDSYTEYDVLINTTPIDPFEIDKDMTGKYVFDIRYHTNNIFLDQASKNGAKAINGVSMLINQGAHSFKIWYEKDPDKKAMYQGAVNGFLKVVEDNVSEQES